MRKVVKIRNLVDVEQSAFINGKRFVIEGGEEKDFSADVANEFLQQCEGFVERVDDADEIGAIYQEPKKDDIVWLANFTGDPDAPATVKRRKKTGRGEWEYVETPNPMADAADIVRHMDGGMLEIETQDGLVAENLGSIEIRIPKYQRRPFTRSVANWMLQRDANGRHISQFHVGRLRISRPKSGFEPDMFWDLDDMRCYLWAVDRTADKGPSAAEVRADAELNALDPEDAVREAKKLCMKRLHMRLADPKYRLFSKSEFETLRGSFEQVSPQPVVPAATSAKSGRSGGSARA